MPDSGINFIAENSAKASTWDKQHYLHTTTKAMDRWRYMLNSSKKTTCFNTNADTSLALFQVRSTLLGTGISSQQQYYSTTLAGELCQS